MKASIRNDKVLQTIIKHGNARIRGRVYLPDLSTGQIAVALRSLRKQKKIVLYYGKYWGMP